MTTKQEQQTEALDRATSGQSTANYDAILSEFAERGIHDAEPRQNVFTYAAWQKLGRQVQKGQHGVKINTWILCRKKGSEETYKRPKSVAVFHISQTEAVS